MRPDLKTNLPWIPDRTIFMTRAGSSAYGTRLPESDDDYRGIAIPPISYIMGLDTFNQVEVKSPDCVIFDLRKFVRLAAACNPNCIELLFTDPSDHLLVTDIGTKLLANRDLFVSKKAFTTFRGYAQTCLKKLRNRDPGPMSDARAKRIEQFGYDTKNAMHLIRLLRMGTEIMTGQGVIVKRPDAEELLSIRKGAWSLAQVIEYAESNNILYAEVEEVATESKTNKVPAAPDWSKINALCVELIQSSFGHKVKVPIMATGPFASCEWAFGSGDLVNKKLTKDEEATA